MGAKNALQHAVSCITAGAFGAAARNGCDKEARVPVNLFLVGLTKLLAAFRQEPPLDVTSATAPPSSQQANN
jgi:hypothetical protein